MATVEALGCEADSELAETRAGGSGRVDELVEEERLEERVEERETISSTAGCFVPVLFSAMCIPCFPATGESDRFGS